MTTDEQRQLIAQAVTEGYPDVDEVCPLIPCGRVFKNYHHFLRCDRYACPMADGGESLLDQLVRRLAESRE